MDLNTLKPYQDFAKRVLLVKQALLSFIAKVKSEKKSILALGATGIAIGYSVAWFIYLTFLIFFTFNSIFKMSTSGEIKAM
jgi:hypothetical protein